MDQNLNSTIDHLHGSYCSLIEETRRWKNPIEGNVIAPSFFFDSRPTADITPKLDQPLPYPEFWLIVGGVNMNAISTRDMVSRGYRPESVMIVNVKRADSNDKVLVMVFVMSPLTGRWSVMNMAKSPPTAVEQVLSLVEDCVFKINAASANGDGNEFEPVRLASINRGRAKSKHGLSPIPKFITIGPAAARQASTEHHGVGGWTMQPHQRRGHWRTRKATGKRFWVRDYAVHGGSDQPRSYHVK